MTEILENFAGLQTSNITGSSVNIHVAGDYTANIGANNKILFTSPGTTTFNVGGLATVTMPNVANASFVVHGGTLNTNVNGNFNINAQTVSPNTSTTSFTSTGPLTMSVGGNFNFTGSSGASFLSSAGTISHFTTGGDLLMATQRTASGAVNIKANGSNIVTAGGNINLTGSASAASPGQGIVLNSVTDVLSVFSGNSTTLAHGTLLTTGPGFGSAGKDVTVVIDTNNPFPQIGTASFSIDGTSALSSNGFPLRIFTAHRFQNNIDPSATFNGVTFVPGPAGVNSATEQWSTYYPSAFGGIPYTFFYKEPGTSIIVPIVVLNFARADFNRAVSEEFSKWTQFPLNFIANILLMTIEAPEQNAAPSSPQMNGVFPITYCTLYHPLLLIPPYQKNSQN